MNETTRAILRRELELKERDLRSLQYEVERHDVVAARFQDDLAKTKAEITDLRAALAVPSALAGQIGSVDLKHGEVMHIHNA